MAIVKTGFVSNSSSTSFIFIFKGKPSEDLDPILRRDKIKSEIENQFGPETYKRILSSLQRDDLSFANVVGDHPYIIDRFKYLKTLSLIRLIHKCRVRKLGSILEINVGEGLPKNKLKIDSEDLIAWSEEKH